MNYYNEFEPKAAAGLRQLIKDGLIPNGDVDTRSITDVRPEDIRKYIQCHFFAGIGGWSRALQIAGWDPERPVWTGSCPCQPFSSAGKQKGGGDDRDLWPVWFNLIRECSPATVFGEQVASAVSHGWLDRVYFDMEAEGYSCGAAVLPACSVDAPHKRDRLWFVANATVEGFQVGRSSEMAQSRKKSEFERCREDGHSDVGDPESIGERQGRPDHEICSSQYADTGQPITNLPGDDSTMANCDKNGCRQAGKCFSKKECHGADGDNSSPLGNSEHARLERHLRDDEGSQRRETSRGSGIKAGFQGCENSAKFWNDHEFITCADGKQRRIPSAESGIRLLAYGVPERVGLLRAGGNAIVPEVAARFIKATM